MSGTDRLPAGSELRLPAGSELRLPAGSELRLPADDHTHTEWSWDAHAGSMLGSCARAVELGLPSIAFTEHVDAVRWQIPGPLRPTLQAEGHHLDDFGGFSPPPLDVEGYLEEIARCRARFPELTILTGIELGEPHWQPDRVRQLLAAGDFQRVLGSLHTVPFDGQHWMVEHLMGPDAPDGLDQLSVLRLYLDGVEQLIAGLPDEVQVLAHLDYPVRAWRGRFDPRDVEEQLRSVLDALAASDRALEINTRVPLASEIVRWWRAAGGRAVSFASDAHRPETVAAGFADAAALAACEGFAPGAHPLGFWHR